MQQNTEREKERGLEEKKRDSERYKEREREGGRMKWLIHIDTQTNK